MSVERASSESDRTVTVIAYALHLFGAITGLPSIIATVLNYVRINRYGGFFDSHHRWMIHSFWWGLLWFVIGWITVWILIGWVILFLAWVWYVYRHVRGLMALLNGNEMPR